MRMLTSTSVVRFSNGEFQTQTDVVVAEEPLEIRVGGRPISVTMRTPEHDIELAAGFLLSEGVVRQREDILRIRSCPRTNSGNSIDVVLDPHVRFDFESLTRHVFAASSCGLCGKATIDAIRTRLDPIAETDASKSLRRINRGHARDDASSPTGFRSYGRLARGGSL